MVVQNKKDDTEITTTLAAHHTSPPPKCHRPIFFLLYVVTEMGRKTLKAQRVHKKTTNTVSNTHLRLYICAQGWFTVLVR